MDELLRKLDPHVVESLAGARLLALDVDGVLTEGRVEYVGENEQQSFCVQDGQGLVWLQRAGVVVTWITGRGCDATRRRAAELGVEELHAGVGPKASVLADLQGRLGIPMAQTIAMGDDLPDLGLAARAAVFAAPSNARDEVKQRAQLVTCAHGGKGAVREVVELILRARDEWSAIVDAAGS
ncbi:MAG: 3-deoxy-D-manno-octulosonate 8-phosphate phosphatase (KDO 8-P phosphatase) [Chlamydiales bacterium]|jgi:3-deoxy-D-manno-octulosonate 8-phosphate phosphatase (KDO 8-P phosphatase)